MCNFKAISLVLLIVSRVASSQNLVVNGDFDTGVAGWHSDVGTISWDPQKDWQGAATSGSANLVYAGSLVDPNMHQCFAVSPNTPYDFGFSTGFGANQGILMTLYFYPTSDCSGPALAFPNLPEVSPADSWAYFWSSRNLSPPNAASAEVVIQPFLFFQSIHIDHVQVVPSTAAVIPILSPLHLLIFGALLGIAGVALIFVRSPCRCRAA